MKKLFATILFGATLFSLFACSNFSVNSNSIKPQVAVIYPKTVGFDDYDAKHKLREENTIDDNFITAINTFSYNTAQAIIRDKMDNFNYSPLSLYYTLALAGTGAGGETQRQIFELLGVSSAEELSTKCGNLYRLLYTDNEISKLQIANSLWLDNNTAFKDSFVSNAADNLYASSFSVDFYNKDSVKAMSKWISDNTNGTLEPELEISSKQILSIINTIYFYDEWINRFNRDATAEDVFHTNDKDVTVDFMNQTFGSAGFARGNNFTRSILGLKDSGQMTFILPDEGVSLSDLISSKESIQALFEGGEKNFGEVVWKIPKFDFGTECKLADTLQTLGIVNAFKPDADFSGITDGIAYISDITQHTHIAIDENGVEASAFTQIDYAGAAMPEGRAEMILNRPFIYGITSTNGTLLFVGVCNNPSI